MKSSSAQALGIILVVLMVLLAVGVLKFLVLIPLGIVDGTMHGLRAFHFDRIGSWIWPWAGFAGFFGLLVLFFWIAVIVWVYRDAESRGMGGAVWALIVFFTHLIGLLVYAVVRSSHPIPQRSAVPPPPISPPKPTFESAPISGTCPTCGKPTEKDHVYCPACGRRHQTSCPKCGKDVQREWRTCAFCGEKL